MVSDLMDRAETSDDEEIAKDTAASVYLGLFHVLGLCAPSLTFAVRCLRHGKSILIQPWYSDCGH